MNGRTVVVTTSDDRPVSIGRVKVSPVDKGSHASPVSIAFETELIHCELGVPLHKLAALFESDDGQHLRYALPPGDSLWQSDRSGPAESTDGPVLETFPLPPVAAKTIASEYPTSETSPAPGKSSLQRTGAALDRLLRKMEQGPDKRNI